MNCCHRPTSKPGPKTASRTNFTSHCAQPHSLFRRLSFSSHSHCGGDQVHRRFRGHLLSFPAAPESNSVVRCRKQGWTPLFQKRKQPVQLIRAYSMTFLSHVRLFDLVSGTTRASRIMRIQSSLHGNGASPDHIVLPASQPPRFPDRRSVFPQGTVPVQRYCRPGDRRDCDGA